MTDGVLPFADLVPFEDTGGELFLDLRILSGINKDTLRGVDLPEDDLELSELIPLEVTADAAAVAEDLMPLLNLGRKSRSFIRSKDFFI